MPAEPFPIHAVPADAPAAGLAGLLGLPHAHYELASWRNESGVVTPSFVPNGFDLVHGNELLAERDPSYPLGDARFIRTGKHTIEAVRAVVEDGEVHLPLEWNHVPGAETAAAVFGGYLLLDAWIGNTDRHHQNWALVVDPSGLRYLAPTFDHAASLGACPAGFKRRGPRRTCATDQPSTRAGSVSTPLRARCRLAGRV